MPTFVVRILSLAAVLPLVACASAYDDDPATGACDVNPELAVAPRAMSSNDGTTNRLTMNGIQLNGIQINGVQINGVQINGVQLNRIALNRIAVNGAAMNELVGVDADGRTLSGEQLVGTTVRGILSNGATIDLAVTAFERSAEQADVALYELAYEGQSLCANGEMGMFVPGVWDERGARRESVSLGGHDASVTFSCLSGVIAKCVRWGYAPWSAGAALHQTCTRMARADYCGTGVSYTMDGTAIDVFDAKEILEPAGDPAFLFEAGWSENGATCVSRTRYEARTPSDDAVLPSCWRDLPTCSSFEEAKAKGASIGNASRPQTRTICP